MPLLLVDVTAALGPLTLLFMQLGPVPDVLRIHKTHTTDTTPLAPLVTMAANGWIWTMYGYIEGNVFPVAVSNCVGVVLGVSYTAVYYKYSRNRAYDRKIIGGFGLYAVLVTIYAVAGIHGLINQSRAQVQNGLGYAGILTVLVFFSSPFEHIAQVFKHRSNAFIPILLVCATAVNSAVWSTYSFLTSDWFIFAPTFTGLLIGSVQFALYVYFQPNERDYNELGTLEANEKDPETASSVELLHRGLDDKMVTPPMDCGSSSQ